MNLNLKLLMGTFYITALMGLVGCAGVLSERTFIAEMERPDEGYWVPGEDFRMIPGDTGTAYRSREELFKRTPASRYERQNYEEDESIRRELKRRESVLSEREYAAYREAQDYFSHDSERIYYLSLSPNERGAYLESKGHSAGTRSGRAPASINHEVNASRSHQLETLELISPFGLDYGPEINVGMAKGQVLEVWGRPARVDVAGDPRHENERWSFYQNGRVKTIYFENGQVQGWSME